MQKDDQPHAPLASGEPRIERIGADPRRGNWRANGYDLVLTARTLAADSDARLRARGSGRELGYLTPDLSRPFRCGASDASKAPG